MKDPNPRRITAATNQGKKLLPFFTLNRDHDLSGRIPTKIHIFEKLPKDLKESNILGGHYWEGRGKTGYMTPTAGHWKTTDL